MCNNFTQTGVVSFRLMGLPDLYKQPIENYSPADCPQQVWVDIARNAITNFLNSHRLCLISSSNKESENKVIAYDIVIKQDGCEHRVETFTIILPKELFESSYE